MLGDHDAARSVLAEARDLCEELEEPLLEVWVQFFQGLAETFSGAIDAGRTHFQASRALHHELGVATGEGRAIMGLGMGFVVSDEPDRAKELFETALSLLAAADDRWAQGTCHMWLGTLRDLGASDAVGATGHFRTAVEMLRPSRDATVLPMALVGQAGVLARRQPADGLRVAATAAAVRARIGGEFPPFYRARLDRVRAAAEAALGEEAEAVWAEGARLGVDEAIGLAFGETRRRLVSPHGLSARELVVAGLVAEGLANKAIAARLQLSVRTVESHVRHALTKLGLNNRTQLATWARDHIQ
jgi:DNA-binding NarL/FixJ family response regulator